MTAQEILGNILKAHNLKVLEYKEWILVEEQLPAISAYTQNYKEYEGGASIRLDIAVMIDNNKIIWESFAGIGKDELSATQDAFQNFSVNSLHVFLLSFWQIEDYEQVSMEEWEIKGQLWHVYIGNYGCKGDFNIPEDLFNTIEELVKNENLEEDIYWFRTYYANINKEEKIIETLKNNEPWLELESKIKNINWADSERFYSLRNFIILKRK